jgi:hypothetical protein
VRVALEATFNGHEDAFRAGVECGLMKLWEVGGHSYAITEARGEELIVWAYQGREVKKFAGAMCQAAHRAHFERVRFRTERPALARMLRLLNPIHEGGGVFSVRVN